MSTSKEHLQQKLVDLKMAEELIAKYFGPTNGLRAALNAYLISTEEQLKYIND